MSADQMIAQTQAQRQQQAKPMRDHMQYQQAQQFNQITGQQMGGAGPNVMRHEMDSGNMSLPGVANQALQGMPFRQYPQFNQQPRLPDMFPGYSPRMPGDGISAPGPRPPGFTSPKTFNPAQKAPWSGMEFGDMTDEEMHGMYQMLSQKGAFQNLEGY
jgi:hypothetical protein